MEKSFGIALDGSARRDTPVFRVTVDGDPGQVRFTGLGVELEGRWASHTGFQSLIQEKTTPTESVALSLASQARATQADFAFAVGDEHRDMGWRILTCYDRRICVRLPSWHFGEVATVLEAMGMKQAKHSDALNNRWGLPITAADIGTVKQALAPILSPGARFTPEPVLARQLRITCGRAGLLGAQEQITFDFQGETT